MKNYIEIKIPRVKGEKFCKSTETINYAEESTNKPIRSSKSIDNLGKKKVCDIKLVSITPDITDEKKANKSFSYFRPRNGFREQFSNLSSIIKKNDLKSSLLRFIKSDKKGNYLLPSISIPQHYYHLHIDQYLKAKIIKKKISLLIKNKECYNQYRNY